MTKRKKLTWGGMRLLRENKGYTQTEWGALLGMSQSQISELETDHEDEPVGADVAERALEAPVSARAKRRKDGDPQPKEPPGEAAPSAPPAYEAAANAFARFLTTLNDLVLARYAAGFRRAPAASPPEAGPIVTPPPPGAEPSAFPLRRDIGVLASGGAGMPRSNGSDTIPGVPVIGRYRGPLQSDVDAVAAGVARRLLPAILGTAALLVVVVGFVTWQYGTVTCGQLVQVLNRSAALDAAACSQRELGAGPGMRGNIGERKKGRPLPVAPSPHQMKPPCKDAPSATAINGGCWVKIADQAPPCSPELFEYGNACWMRVLDVETPPSSETPRRPEPH